MKKYLAVLAVSLASLGCNRDNSSSDKASLFVSWDIIYLDFQNSRYILNSLSDTLTISNFKWTQSAMQEESFISERVNDTTYNLSIKESVKNKIVDNAIRVLKNPISSTSSDMDYPGAEKLCIIKKETMLCYYFSYHGEMQNELRDIIKLVNREKNKVEYHH